MMAVQRLFSLLLLLGLVACDTGNPDLAIETLRADEAEQAAATRENFRNLVENYRTAYVARGAHAKGHACVRAWFEVDEDISPRYQHGVFATPGRRYRTWVRFSNGHFDLRHSADTRDDARGLAIKLMQIDGVPMEQDDIDTATQDFLLTNSAVFFVRNMPDYNQLVANPEDFLGFFFPGWNPFKWKIRELLTAPKTLTAPPASLLDPGYFSITPYKLGGENVKYAARACTRRDTGVQEVTGDTDIDFLQQQLAEELATTAACFRFAIQTQKPAQGMDLDDATTAWPEEESPFVPVATLRIPAQHFQQVEQLGFCENLSFAPWHALPEHRPIGQLNRLRRHAYAASSVYRHRQNGIQVPPALAFWCREPGWACADN